MMQPTREQMDESARELLGDDVYSAMKEARFFATRIWEAACMKAFLEDSRSLQRRRCARG